MNIVSTDLLNSPDPSEETAGPAPVLDRHSVARLIAKEYGGLVNLIRRKLNDRELADDLLNEAIAVTLDHARKGRIVSEDGIGGYVFKVSMNLLRNYQRNSDNRGGLRANIADLDSVAAYDVVEIENEEKRAHALRIIASLDSARDRQVVIRFYLDEAEKEIICKELGLSALQFEQILSRARKRLRRLIDTQGLSVKDFF